jgi:hypothetical protein
MTQISENRDTPEMALGRSLAADADVVASGTIHAGAMAAIDKDVKLQMADDAAGLRVLGRSPDYTENSSGSERGNVEHGIFLYSNSAVSPVVRSMTGRVCYVENAGTVAAGSVNLVPAGIIYDVDSEGVWVDQRAEAIAVCAALARPKIVSVTGTSVTVSGAQAFQGNVIFACDNASGVTVTLPSAVPGYRVGVQRTNAAAGHDVTIQAGTGDSVRGSAAAGTASNTTDAVSDVLWLECESASAWVDAAPAAPDRAVWQASA